MIQYEDLTIVGIGASAGGFEAFQKFLPKLSHNPSIAYIIVQHLDPNRETLFGNLLSKFSPLKLTPIQHKEKIVGKHIYYCPPNKNVTIKNGKLFLSKPENKAYPKPSIDIFFNSLALEKKEKAIGIILSGTGNDGTKGIIDIVRYGGIALAEDEGAKFYSMPKSAIDTNKVLVSMPAELLAEGIEHIIKDQNYFDKYFTLQDSVKKIFALLYEKTHINFSSYKKLTLTRRIKRRIHATKSKNTNEYLQFLQTNSQEIENLKNELLITVTSFFRDKEAFMQLKKYLYKLIIKDNESIRIWVVACATGEEPYSIAILICEILEQFKINKQVTIFATDLNEHNIVATKNYTYTSEQMDGLDNTYKTKYFEQKKDKYRPKKILRDIVIFSKHDIIQDLPFLNIDLISCRNLLIYFNAELQQNILNKFHYSLKKDGLLFLGKSENLGYAKSLFLTINKSYKIYQKINNFNQTKKNTSSYIQKGVNYKET